MLALRTSDLAHITRAAKVSNRERIKILTHKQMLPILPIVLEQVKAENTSGNLVNEIRQIIHSLYRKKKVSKKVYNKIINSIKL